MLPRGANFFIKELTLFRRGLLCRIANRKSQQLSPMSKKWQKIFQVYPFTLRLIQCISIQYDLDSVDWAVKLQTKYSAQRLKDLCCLHTELLESVEYTCIEEGEDVSDSMAVQADHGPHFLLT